MIRRLGGTITILPPITDATAPSRGASARDIVDMGNGAFGVLYSVGTRETKLDANGFPFEVSTATTSFAIVSSGGALLNNQLLVTTTNSPLPSFSATEGRGGDALVFFKPEVSLTVGYNQFGANGSREVGPRQLTGDFGDGRLQDSLVLPDGRTALLFQYHITGQEHFELALLDSSNRLVREVKDWTAPGGLRERNGVIDTLSNGRIVLGFEQFADLSKSDIAFTIRSPDGLSLTNPVLITPSTAGNRTLDDIEALTSGGFVAAYSHGFGTRVQDQGATDLRIFDNNGKAIGSAIRLFAPDFDQGGADISAISGGRFLVTWTESVTGEFGFERIFGQMYDRLGTKIGNKTTLSPGAPFDGSQIVKEIDPGIVAMAFTRDIEEEGILALRFDVGKAGTSSNDALNSSVLGRVLEGLDGNDRLTGGSTADFLIGGRGADVMRGGNGLDHFVFKSPSDLGRSTGRDEILDFRSGVDDIDLSAIDANGSAAGNGTFRFLAREDAGFTGVRGQLRFEWIDKPGTASDYTLVEADTNGDRKADFQIELFGRIALKTGDFDL